LRYWRLWNDDHGDSHLELVDVEWHAVEGYAAGVPPVDVSDAVSTGEGHFSRLPAGWFGDWHPAPSRQIVVLLTGTLEVVAVDGAMTGGPGTVWLVEDTEGKGHQTRVVGDEDAIRWSVTLGDK
jgi:hypothetical protein